MGGDDHKKIAGNRSIIAIKKAVATTTAWALSPSPEYRERGSALDARLADWYLMHSWGRSQFSEVICGAIMRCA
jgi:hypothetical protein